MRGWKRRLTGASTQGPNCTVGIWFNPPPAAQPTREYTRCRDDILDLMFNTCFEVQGEPLLPLNVAAVNLKTLPGLSGSGSQVDVGYPSYIMVPETFDDTDGGYQEGEGQG